MMAGRERSKQDVVVWLALFGPAIAWILAQQMGFLLAPWICNTGRKWVLLVITGIALLGAAAGGFVSWRSWKRQTSAPPTPESGGSWRRFLAASAVVLSLFFFVAILALAVPELVHRPCD